MNISLFLRLVYRLLFSLLAMGSWIALRVATQQSISIYEILIISIIAAANACNCGKMD